jgi:hypothetical protein
MGGNPINQKSVVYWMHHCIDNIDYSVRVLLMDGMVDMNILDKFKSPDYRHLTIFLLEYEIKLYLIPCLVIIFLILFTVFVSLDVFGVIQI